MARHLPILAFLLAACLAPPAAGGPLPGPDGLPPVVEAPSASLPETAASRRRLLGLFADGVLRREGGHEVPVVKWSGPVSVSLRGGPARRHAPFVAALVDELATLTGLSLELVIDQNWAGEIDILLLDQAGYWPPQIRPKDPSSREAFACAALPMALRGTMRRALVLINAGTLPAETVEACLVEELAQSMGLVGEVDDDRATLLSDDVGFRRLTATDRVLLRALYDPALPAGTTREDALRQLPAILAQALRTQACRDPGDGNCGRTFSAR
jgi:hypothetical protein